MISCNHAAMLIDKKEATSISFMESLKLKFHVLLCATCKKYKVMSKQIDQTLKKYVSQHNTVNVHLSEEKKEAIIRKLNE
ncbi:hypothetical protein [Flammeovirga kamogawensis]|uniref:Zf-HC2 domain-containing protein n=1 Tax=Flammeovirga kamogawensis TaxID=373891 RepID=A0ABX8GYV2_9BACT|nr:hypothetical protein [Flammeovirga kamogawensis]MBB6460945.1 hypothetical protein [Flammeovirga kamogawensis]QWG08287.1 hypothetical protein KM029_04950 [Flammeovirga kamogawensis]TRX66586.1 hypothetical protein EO216_00020 [Flammeovirga kamogawensis]